MIYDVIMFNNELDLLEIRLNQHNSFVDKFIIIESAKTYNGTEKFLYYKCNKERFRKFYNKICHIITDFTFYDNQEWKFEHLQRNIIKGLTFNPDDIIIYTDCDEIIRDRNVIELAEELLMSCDIVTLQMDLCFYYLNTRVKEKKVQHESYHLNSCFGNKWHMGKIILPKILGKVKNAYEIRQYKIENPDNVIRNAGWHFSNLGEADKILDKFKAFSHWGEPIFKNVSKESIEENKRKLADPLGREGVVLECFNDYPEYIRQNINKFGKLIYEISVGVKHIS